MTAAATATNNDKHARNISATPENGVQCALDGAWCHSIKSYLEVAHPNVSIEDYRTQYPDAALISPFLLQQATARQQGAQMNMQSNVVPFRSASHAALDWSVGEPKVGAFAEVFGLGNARAAKNVRGEDINVEILGDLGPELAALVPEIDPNHIWNIDDLKSVMMGVTLRMNTLLWGLHGTGKTSTFEQYAARTNRPQIRVQHTATTEESHIVGQYVLKNGETVFEPGPLALAMRYGIWYLADEYDFALPNVIAVYQPVMEGKALIIKEAPPEWRVVKPHPNFRLSATGNTNGSGDETGLYQGTQIQNAANYSRFGITVEISYMPEKQEIAVVAGQAAIHTDEAERLVKIGNEIRQAYRRSEIGCTVSPRELINAGKLGRVMGGQFMSGLEKAFLNRLNQVDRKACADFAQRILGN